MADEAGKKPLARALPGLDAGAFEALAHDLVIHHYDTRYAKSRSAAGDPAFRLDVRLDADGIDALSMRRIGKALGVEGMALYNHVASKDEILDGIVERVLVKVPNPSPDGDWKSEMRERTITARQSKGVSKEGTFQVASSESRIEE